MAYDGRTEQAIDCRHLLELRAQGYRPQGDRDYAVERYEGSRCLALTLLKTARPARVSALVRFRLSPEAADVLPPTLATTFSTLEDDALRAAESQGKTLRQLQRNLRVRMDGDILVVSSDTWESHIEIYARADFDGDGVDDLLVAVHEIATQGTFDSTKLLLLTRAKPRGRIRTVKRVQ